MNKNAVEDGNLVMFPASKNFPVTPEVDPLEELLNEFSHLEDDFFDEELDSFDEEQLELEGPSKRLSQKSTHALSENELFDLISDQIKLLEDSHNRIRHYLDEIEMFLPSKK